MLGLFSAVIAGYLIYESSDFKTAIISSVSGYLLFVVYAWIRAGMLVNDPVQRLSLAVNGKPRGSKLRIERLISTVGIPLGTAFLVKYLLFD